MVGMTKPIDVEDKQGSGGGCSPGATNTSMPPERLEKLFGDPLPKREIAMWSLMDAAQRARALQRANALVRYGDGQGGVPARSAAADAGVTLVRFYQMNARWREEQSLGALGVGAQPERGRKSQFAPEVNAVLQSAVADLVRDEKASVRALASRGRADCQMIKFPVTTRCAAWWSVLVEIGDVGLRLETSCFWTKRRAEFCGKMAHRGSYL